LLRLPPFDSTEEAFVSKWIPALGVVTLVAVGCMAETHEAGSVSVGLAEAGPWDVPLATRRIADPQYVAYDGAGPWIGSAGCGPGLLSGTAALGAYLDRAFPQVRGIGGYSCRRNTGDTSRTSVHGTGRALDVFIPLDGGAADNGLGDEVANWLIEHAEEIGVQYVIWDRWQWISAAAPTRTTTTSTSSSPREPQTAARRGFRVRWPRRLPRRPCRPRVIQARPTVRTSAMTMVTGRRRPCGICTAIG
jgi:hypothetical protein